MVSSRGLPSAASYAVVPLSATAPVTGGAGGPADDPEPQPARARASVTSGVATLQAARTSVLAPQQGPGQLSPVVDLRLDGAEGGADLLGDVLVRHAVHVAQDQRLDVLRMVALDGLHR